MILGRYDSKALTRGEFFMFWKTNQDYACLNKSWQVGIATSILFSSASCNRIPFARTLQDMHGATCLEEKYFCAVFEFSIQGSGFTAALTTVSGRVANIYIA